MWKLWHQAPFGQVCLPVRAYVGAAKSGRWRGRGHCCVHGAELAVHLRKAGPPLRVALPAGLDQRAVGCRQVVWHGRPHAVEHLVQYLQVKITFSGLMLLLAQCHHAPLQTCLLLQAPLPSGLHECSACLQHVAWRGGPRLVIHVVQDLHSLITMSGTSLLARLGLAAMLYQPQCGQTLYIEK